MNVVALEAGADGSSMTVEEVRELANRRPSAVLLDDPLCFFACESLLALADERGLFVPWGDHRGR